LQKIANKVKGSRKDGEESKSPTKTSKWREEHNQMLQAIQIARQMQLVEESGDADAKE